MWWLRRCLLEGHAPTSKQRGSHVACSMVGPGVRSGCFACIGLVGCGHPVHVCHVRRLVRWVRSDGGLPPIKHVHESSGGCGVAC
jgi:hypothetical protein